MLLNAGKDGHLIHLEKIAKEIPLQDFMKKDKHNNLALSYAIDNGYVHVLNFCYWKIIIKRRQKENLPDDAYDSAGFCLIHWAAICDQTNEIQRLGKVETINVKNQSGCSPLFLSVYIKNIATTRILLELKADPNTVNSSGVTPLHRAAEEGSKDIAKVLVHAKASVLQTLPNDYTNAILIAKVNDHIEIFNMLYEAVKTQFKETSQKDSNVEDEMILLYTDLFLATMDGDISSIKKFLQMFSNIDINCYAYGATLLDYAVKKGHTEITKLLLGHGADPTKLNAVGYSPLLVALENEHFDIAETLLHTDDISNFVDINNFSQLITKIASYADILVACAEQGYEMILQLLLRHGGDRKQVIQQSILYFQLH
jgi:ankyrin repeat protein